MCFVHMWGFTISKCLPGLELRALPAISVLRGHRRLDHNSVYSLSSTVFQLEDKSTWPKQPAKEAELSSMCIPYTESVVK